MRWNCRNLVTCYGAVLCIAFFQSALHLYCFAMHQFDIHLVLLWSIHTIRNSFFYFPIATQPKGKKLWTPFWRWDCMTKEASDQSSFLLIETTTEWPMTGVSFASGWRSHAGALKVVYMVGPGVKRIGKVSRTATQARATRPKRRIKVYY